MQGDLRRQPSITDFALQHRANPARRWLVEIVGSWTPDYVTRKLARYLSARLSNLILCIDEERNCANTDLPPGARIVRFRRRVEPAAVLQLIADTPGRGRSIRDRRSAGGEGGRRRPGDRCRPTCLGRGAAAGVPERRRARLIRPRDAVSRPTRGGIERRSSGRCRGS
jgi:hypothetical protein